MPADNRRRRWTRTTGIGIAMAVLSWLPAVPAHATPAHAQADVLPASQKVGPLPLLAALAIGIVIAVISVIAFLQMTLKGRDTRETAEWNGTEGAGRGAEMDDADADEAELLADSPEDGEAEDAFSAYTLPLSPVATQPLRAASEEAGVPRLCGVGGEFTGSCFRLDEGGLALGRDPSLCQVVFPMDIGEISRRHCTLRFEQGSGRFLIEDHGSSNGTFFQNGERLQPGRSYELQTGDRFALSGATHWFEVRI